MLHYFPTIYPDEFWYSVISRYHIRSGLTAAGTIRQLFPNRTTEAIGCFFPNNLIYSLSNNLPNEVFDVKDIVLNHTLFKYFCRMHTKEQKRDMLKQICKGTLVSNKTTGKITRINPTKLMCCPVCKKVDIEKYGESYWHLSHQIPKSNICIKHQCRLIPVHLKGTQLAYQFLVPEDYSDDYEVDYKITVSELNLAITFHDFLHMPLLAGPTEGYNNIFQGLLNRGYGKGVQNGSWKLDLESIYADLVELFGTDIVVNLLGNQLTSQTLTGIKKWTMRSPERYVLFSTLLNQKANITFGQKKIEDELKLRLLKLSAENKLMQKSTVAKNLGISVRTLENLAKYYNITPFWTQGQNYLNSKTTDMYACVSEVEKKIIKQYYEENGYETGSQFLRDCILRVVDFTKEI